MAPRHIAVALATTVVVKLCDENARLRDELDSASMAVTVTVTGRTIMNRADAARLEALARQLLVLAAVIRRRHGVRGAG